MDKLIKNLWQDDRGRVALVAAGFFAAAGLATCFEPLPPSTTSPHTGGRRSGTKGTAAHTGLVNVGNTCFANVILQSLANCEDARAYIANNARSSPLIETLDSIIQDVTPGCGAGRSIDPSPLFEFLQKRMDIGRVQQDSHEFLVVLIDEIEELVASQALTFDGMLDSLIGPSNPFIISRCNDEEAEASYIGGVTESSSPLRGLMTTTKGCRDCGNSWPGAHTGFVCLSLFVPKASERPFFDLAVGLREFVSRHDIDVDCPFCSEELVREGVTRRSGGCGASASASMGGASGGGGSGGAGGLSGLSGGGTNAAATAPAESVDTVPLTSTTTTTTTTTEAASTPPVTSSTTSTDTSSHTTNTTNNNNTSSGTHSNTPLKTSTNTSSGNTSGQSNTTHAGGGGGGEGGGGGSRFQIDLSGFAAAALTDDGTTTTTPAATATATTTATTSTAPGVGARRARGRQSAHFRSGEYSQRACTGDCFQQMTVSRCPPVLTIHLHRVHYSNLGFQTKVNRYVEFPLTLNMRPYMYFGDGEECGIIGSPSASSSRDNGGGGGGGHGFVVERDGGAGVGRGGSDGDAGFLGLSAASLVGGAGANAMHSTSTTTTTTTTATTATNANSNAGADGGSPIHTTREGYSPSDVLYELNSVVVHLGISASGGHYIVYRRVKKESPATNVHGSDSSGSGSWADSPALTSAPVLAAVTTPSAYAKFDIVGEPAALPEYDENPNPSYSLWATLSPTKDDSSGESGGEGGGGEAGGQSQPRMVEYDPRSRRRPRPLSVSGGVGECGDGSGSGSGSCSGSGSGGVAATTATSTPTTTSGGSGDTCVVGGGGGEGGSRWGDDYHWVEISDQRVTPVSEATVLNCKASILFYELVGE